MKKPLSIYIICIYAFAGAIISVLAALMMLLDHFQDSRVLMENLQPYLWFQSLSLAIIVVSAIGLWQGAAWGRTLYVAGELVLLIFGLIAGLNYLVLFNGFIYYVIITFFLFRLPVQKYLSMPESEFVVWHENYRVFGKVKSQSSDLSKIFGVVLMIIGGMGVAFSSVYFAFHEPVLVIAAIVFLGVGLIMWGAGAFLWGMSRFKMTAGITLIPAGVMWIFMSAGMYVVMFTNWIDDLLEGHEDVLYDLRMAEVWNADALLVTAVIGVLMVLAGYFTITRQIEADRKRLNPES